jgi:hypothetical protein
VSIAPPPPKVVFQFFWGNADHGSDGKSFNSVALTLNKGMYSVLLGDTNIPNMRPIAADVFTNTDVRLRVWFSQSDYYTTFEQLRDCNEISVATF